MSIDWNKVKAAGHFVEQPNVIRKVGRQAGLWGGLGGFTLLTAADTWRAQPEERRKTLIRDTVVLGATAAGTILGAKYLMPLPTKEEAKKATEFFVGSAKEALSELRKNNKDLYKSLDGHLDGLKDKMQLGVSDFKKIMDIVKTETKDSKKADEHITKLLGKDEEPEEFWDLVKKKMWQKGDPTKGIEEGEGLKMGSFFAVGLGSVVSGLLGGVAANKINGVKDPDATVNMVKEGIFQFTANIALCAVGALGAIIAMAPADAKLKSMGLTGKLLKTGGIGAGLSLGIFGGGVIANKLGQNYINPFFDKLQGKEPAPPEQKEEGKRNIEFWDAILHLDDVPTAMALAGLEIVEPFIPLFFAFSGYRTGIGYRNDESSKNKGEEKQAKQQPKGFAKPQTIGFEATSQPFGRVNATRKQDAPQAFGKQNPQPFQWAYPAYNAQYR